MKQIHWNSNALNGQHILLDGGFAIELSKQDIDLNHVLWTAKALLESPDAVKAAHQAYVNAGADIISTCSYQATPQRLSELGLSDPEIDHLFAQSVSLAREASKNRNTQVAASIGPYGAYLANGAEYTGEYDIGEIALAAFHRPKFATLAKHHPDFFAIETIPSIDEVRAISALASEFSDQAMWISLSCKDASRLADGSLICEAVERLNDLPNLVAIGANCFNPEFASDLVVTIEKCSRKPLIVYPNKGENYDPVTKTWEAKSNEDFIDQVVELCRDRSIMIGGCCQIDSQAIKALGDRLSDTAL